MEVQVQKALKQLQHGIQESHSHVRFAREMNNEVAMLVHEIISDINAAVGEEKTKKSNPPTKEEWALYRARRKLRRVKDKMALVTEQIKDAEDKIK